MACVVANDISPLCKEVTSLRWGVGEAVIPINIRRNKDITLRECQE